MFLAPTLRAAFGYIMTVVERVIGEVAYIFVVIPGDEWRIEDAECV
jgi:hypothetical protein